MKRPTLTKAALLGTELLAAALMTTACATKPSGPPLGPPQSVFVVFFPTRNPLLDPEAKQIVANAAQAAKDQKASSIVVTAYAEAKTEAAKVTNQRAAIVTNELVVDGIPAAQIVPAPIGKDETGLGVGDRRVEIRLVAPGV